MKRKQKERCAPKDPTPTPTPTTLMGALKLWLGLSLWLKQETGNAVNADTEDVW